MTPINQTVFQLLKNKQTLTHLLIIFFVAIGFGLLSGRLFISDMEDIDGIGELAAQVSQHHNFGGSIRRGPVYPLLLAVFLKIFGIQKSSVIIFHTLLLALLGVNSYLISRSLYKNPRIAFFTGLIIVINPMCIWYVPKYWVELLFANLLLFLLWSSYKSFQNPSLKNLIKFGFWAAIASLCKGVTLLYPIFLAVFILLLKVLKVNLQQQYSVLKLLKLAIVPTVVMLLVISPWTIRNHKVSGTWTLVSSNMGVEFFRGNFLAEYNSFLLQKTNEEIWEVATEKYSQIKEEQGFNSTGFDEKKEQYFNTQMKETIIKTPHLFMLKVLKQIPSFWYRGGNFKKSMLFLASALGLIFIFFLSFKKMSKENEFPYFVLALIVYMNLLHAAILALARYSMPLYSPMFIVAISGLYQIWISKRSLSKETRSN